MANFEVYLSIDGTEEVSERPEPSNFEIRDIERGTFEDWLCNARLKLEPF
jgi:hypothetical protein